jgi:hypothetical protein
VWWSFFLIRSGQAAIEDSSLTMGVFSIGTNSILASVCACVFLIIQLAASPFVHAEVSISQK